MIDIENLEFSDVVFDSRKVHPGSVFAALALIGAVVAVEKKKR